MIIYTHRWKPTAKWVHRGDRVCPACHSDNYNWVGFQMKQYMGAFWITIIPGGSSWLVMCDACQTFFYLNRKDWKELEDAHKLGKLLTFWLPETRDEKGRLVHEVRGGFWSQPWEKQLDRLKQRQE